MLISVVIFFVVVGVIYNIAYNSKYLSSLIESQKDFDLYSSVALIEQKKGNYYYLLKDFNLSNDNIIHTLKKEKVNLEIKEINEYNFTFKIIRAFNKFHSNECIEIKK